jgi:hypothetical protein
VRFWDASAVIPLCLTARSSPRVVPLLQEDEGIAAWWGTMVECHSAFTRLRRQGDLGIEGLERARQALHRLGEGWSEIAPGPRLREEAIRLLGVHPLRAADALQLAAALGWADRRPLSQDFISLDPRLREAARAEGFTVLPREWP